MFHAWESWPLSVWEKCFKSSIRNCKKCRADTNDALHWIGELQEIYLTSLLQVKIKARYTQKRTTSSTRHLSQFIMPHETWFWLPLASTWHYCDARVQDWKHISSPLNTTKQGATFSSMEHKKLDEKPEISRSFQLVSYLGFIVLCVHQTGC